MSQTASPVEIAKRIGFSGSSVSTAVITGLMGRLNVAGTITAIATLTGSLRKDKISSITTTLPQNIIDSLVRRMYPPTGNWRDFHHDHNFYQFLKSLVRMGLMWENDLPPEPQITDYADPEPSGTRGG